MQSHECYRRLQAVNIQPVLAVLDHLQFVDICVGSTDPKHPPCSVVPPRTPMPEAFPRLVQSLGLGGETYRLFLRKLGPRQGIPLHVDDWIPQKSGVRRFHVPLVSHPDIVMRWPDDGQAVHLEPGYVWEVRYNRLHEVVNLTDFARIHIQIDQQGATIA